MTPRVPTVRLCVKSLMEARDVTPYALVTEAARRGHALSETTAYRLFHGRARTISLANLAALCDVLECQPGDLFTRA